MSNLRGIEKKIAEFIKGEGRLLYGFASVESLREGFAEELKGISEGLNYAISIAIPLNLEVLKGIENQPTVLYKHLYRQANYFLDRVALKLSLLLEAEGYRSIPIPASVYVDREKRRGHLSHRDVAWLAGIGWWGKNNLIVSPVYGSGIRLATVLTEVELSPTGPLEGGGCEDCDLCARACPARAIGDSLSQFNREACFAKVREFEKRVIGVGICGICVKACALRFEARRK